MFHIWQSSKQAFFCALITNLWNSNILHNQEALQCNGCFCTHWQTMANHKPATSICSCRVLYPLLFYYFPGLMNYHFGRNTSPWISLIYHSHFYVNLKFWPMWGWTTKVMFTFPCSLHLVFLISPDMHNFSLGATLLPLHNLPLVVGRRLYILIIFLLLP